MSALPLTIKALANPTIHWRTGDYRLAWGGVARRLNDEQSKPLLLPALPSSPTSHTPNGQDKTSSSTVDNIDEPDEKKPVPVYRLTSPRRLPATVISTAADSCRRQTLNTHMLVHQHRSNVGDSDAQTFTADAHLAMLVSSQ
jgi:hypothetical protein